MNHCKPIFFAFAVVFLSTTLSIADTTTFTPRVFVTQEYTDNVFLSPKGEQKSDFITIYGVSADVRTETQVSGAEIFYTPSYSYYSKFNDLNGVRHSANFNGWLDLSRYTRLTLTDTYLQSEDVPEWELDSPFTENRFEQKSNRLSGRLETDFSERNSASLGFENDWLQSESPTVLNRIIYRPTAGITWGLFDRVSTTLDGSWSFVDNGDPKLIDETPQQDYERSDGRFRLTYQWDRQFSTYGQYRHSYQNVRNTSGENFQVYNGTAGFTYNYSDDIQVEIGGGYLYQDYLDQEDNPSFVMDSDIRSRWEIKRTIIDLTVRSGYQYTEFDTSNTGLELFGEASGSISYQLTKTLSVSTSGLARYTDYNQDDNNRSAWYYTGSVRARWLLFRWCEISGGYIFQKRESSENIPDSVETREYVENKGEITISLFPGAFRFN